MKLAEHEVYILNVPTDDYENFERVLIEVTDFVETEISESKVLEGIKKLVSQGLLDVFDYDNQQSKFHQISFEQVSDIKSVWFLITERGRQVLDENWTDEFIKKWE
jgi:hypothetical protein